MKNDTNGMLRFVKLSKVGDVRYFEGSDMVKFQAAVHSACYRHGKKCTCGSYLAVANGLAHTVPLLRVEIIDA